MAFRLTDTQWLALAPIVARPSRAETRGRKRRSDRDILNGILWILENNARWRRLRGEDAPPFQTCYRRFHEWYLSGALFRAVECLARDLEERGRVPLRSCFMDNLFTPGYENMFLMVNPDDEAESRHWSVRTRYFFESSHVWKLLLLIPSPWIRERLPHDLLQRSGCI